MEGNNKPAYIIDVNGQQAFTADWALAMFQAQSRRVTRANRIAIASFLISIVSFTGLLILIAR